MDDLIRRQDAIKAVESMPNCYNGFSDTYDKACFIGLLEEVPATSTCDFWDSESNYCALYRPFAQPERWIPVKTRPMDEEEKQSIKPYLEEHYGYTLDECDCILFDCPMPDDGQEVWVCSKCGNVWQDSCVIDEGIGLEENGDWEDIVAWMPFERPKPWRGEANE